jgi:hypothetical protein
LVTLEDPTITSRSVVFTIHVLLAAACGQVTLQARADELEARHLVPSSILPYPRNLTQGEVANNQFPVEQRQIR